MSDWHSSCIYNSVVLAIACSPFSFDPRAPNIGRSIFCSAGFRISLFAINNRQASLNYLFSNLLSYSPDKEEMTKSLETSKSSLIKMITKHEPKGGIFIGDAPDEVLEIIFSKLPRDAGLIKVAQVCERFKALVLPLLYRSLRLDAKHMRADGYVSLKPEELPPGLMPESLSLRLKHNPDLCRNVRKLNLTVHNVGWYENPSGHRKLMTLLPSIQEISLNPPPKEYNFPMSNRLATMSLDFIYDDKLFWAPSRLIDATPFNLNNYLSKPSLRKLQFKHTEISHYMPIHSGDVGSSAITDLRFIDWLPQELEILGYVLPSVKHLKHFVVEANGCSFWHNSKTHGLAPHDYGLLLQPHSTSLEELIIAYSDGTYNDGTDFPPTSTPLMGTLTNYHNLKRLAIPEPFLVGLEDMSFHQLLPPLLEELQMQYPMGVKNPVLDRQGDVGSRPPYRLMRMKRLAENKASIVPRLKHVIWWFQQTPWQVSVGDPPPYNPNTRSRTTDQPPRGPLYGPPEDMYKLAEDFMKVGVKFEWVSMPRFKYTPFGEFLGI